MSTALAKIERTEFLALDRSSDLYAAQQANMDGPPQISDLIRITIPTGGSTTWTWEDASGERSASELQGLLVCVAKRGTLWPSDDPTGSRPILVTNDMISAHLACQPDDDFGDIDREQLMKLRRSDGTWDWNSLPWTQWGSGKNGGKRAKESRLLFMLLRDTPYPVIVTASPGSLKVVRRFVSFMLGAPHYRCVVSLGLKKLTNATGQPYAQIVPRLLGVIDEETGQEILEQYTEPLREACDQVASYSEVLDGETVE